MRPSHLALMLSGLLAIVLSLYLTLTGAIPALVDSSHEPPKREVLTLPERPVGISTDYQEAMDHLDYDSWGWSGNAVVPGFDLTLSSLAGVYPFVDAEIMNEDFAVTYQCWQEDGSFSNIDLSDTVDEVARDGDLGNIVGVRMVTYHSPSHPNWSMSVALQVYSTCRQAREALLAKYTWKQSVPSESDWKMWERVDVNFIPDLGDVNLVYESEKRVLNGMEAPLMLTFVRRNVIVMVNQKSGIPELGTYAGAGPLALHIDGLLNSATTVDAEDFGATRATFVTSYQRSELKHGWTEHELSTKNFLGQTDYSFSISPPSSHVTAGYISFHVIVSPANSLGQYSDKIAGIGATGTLRSVEIGEAWIVYFAIDKTTLIVSRHIDQLNTVAR